MKLSLPDWTLTVQALRLMHSVKREEQEKLATSGDLIGAKTAYVLSERAGILANRIESETLG